MSLQIAPLGEAHLEEAAALACARYSALREQLPLLPARYAEVAEFLPLLQNIAQKAPGVVAVRGPRLVGFLLGFVLADFMGQRSMYSPEWANGVALEEGRRVYEEMYGRLAAEWVASGCCTHLVTLLANDPAGLEAWQWLGFGLAAVDGLRGLEPVPGTPATGLKVRRATLADAPEANAFGEALGRHLASSPIFWPHEHKDYGEWLQEPANVLWLAYAGEEAVGAMGMVRGGNPDGCQVTQDKKTVSIVMAYTLEHDRGRGVATALLSAALEWARGAGYERCAVDFEPMNYLAARFWLGHFAPVCYSLLRRVAP